MNALKFYVLAFTNLNGVDIGIEKKIAAGFILLILVLLPLFYARLLYKREIELYKQELKEKFGKLYEGLNTVTPDNSTSTRPLTWLYSPLFLVRRGFFAAITVFIIDVDHTNEKITMHLITSLVYVSALLARG